MKITFITPHQSPTSGGAYIIQQYARHVTINAQSTLLVRQDKSSALPDVRTIAVPKINPDLVPRADFLIVPADCDSHTAIAELPPSKGLPVLYFQGWGDRKNASKIKKGFRIARKRGYKILCCSEYLKQEALKYGLDATVIRHGLDSNIFHPPVSAPTGLMISMLSHKGKGKRIEDGLTALHLVQKKLPQARFHFFGDHPPCFKGNFTYRAKREEVADLLRKSTIFVCSSLREGFGLPGLEAMACGAVLATTDTGGCREYAIHEKTALLSLPKRPAVLAKNILRLATDQPLRDKLRSQALTHIKNTFSSWDQAAQNLLDELSKLKKCP
jgi:glycosyltransferase involved in cell wall biosynthesis